MHLKCKISWFVSLNRRLVVSPPCKQDGQQAPKTLVIHFWKKKFIQIVVRRTGRKKERSSWSLSKVLLLPLIRSDRRRKPDSFVRYRPNETKMLLKVEEGIIKEEGKKKSKLMNLDGVGGGAKRLIWNIAASSSLMIIKSVYFSVSSMLKVCVYKYS